MEILTRTAPVLILVLFLGATAGCKHTPPKSTMPVSEIQAPTVTRAARSTVDPTEKRFQQDINLMQEQIGMLTTRTEALARFHGSQMGPKWIEKVQAVREDASRPSERLRYLEATKALLARKLQALRAELKVYEEFELSDPTVSLP